MSRKAFTLIEMLVVIVIIVIAMTLAVPAIRSLTGSRSQEAAQNTLTTALGAARAEAMAMQRVEGIMFFLDTTSDRIMCVAVMETQAQPATDNGAGPMLTYLTLVPDKDPLYLPAGVWLWTMRDINPSYQDLFNGARYLGFNAFVGPNQGDYTSFAAQNPPMVNIPGGVILFDGTGRLTVRPYGFRNASGNPLDPASQMGKFLFPTASNPGALNVADWPTHTTVKFYLASQVGFVMFDRETFLNQTDATSGKNFVPFNDDSMAKSVTDYLDIKDGSPFYVNRYDATLMSAQ